MRIRSTTDALARFGKALSDPIRAEILMGLRNEPASAADLAGQIGATGQILSTDLACMGGCGMVAAVPGCQANRPAAPTEPSTLEVRP
ncbi:ArsR/SmtB family transcription factor [Arthrobacter sp. NPDC058288]|uniref:ArsR/SmtB family transcription factor n=1 Tax=Arthrobacter sp. NPDC058288 TaxID=3346424 RepID=UPI0036EB33F0